MTLVNEIMSQYPHNSNTLHINERTNSKDYS